MPYKPVPTMSFSRNTTSPDCTGCAFARARTQESDETFNKLRKYDDRSEALGISARKMARTVLMDEQSYAELLGTDPEFADTVAAYERQTELHGMASTMCYRTGGATVVNADFIGGVICGMDKLNVENQ